MASVNIINERIYLNSNMIPSKIASLLIGLRNSSFVTFLTVFFVSVGLSRFQAGLITGLMQTLPILTGPFWCYISHKTGRRKLILFLLSMGSTFPLVLLPLVARCIYPQSKYKCNETPAFNNTHGLIDMNKNVNECEEQKKKVIKLLFHVLLAIGVVSSMFLQSLQSYVNLLVVNVVKKSRHGVTYGGQRCFTTIGVSLGSYFAGKAVNHFKVLDMSQYTPVFIFYLPYTLLLFPTGCYLIGQLDYAEKLGIVNEQTPCIQSHEGCNRFYNSNVLFFITSTANLLFWHSSQLYVTNVMKRDKSEMEFVFILSVVTEVLFFPFASKVIRLLRGSVSAIMFCIMIHFGRLMLISNNMDYHLLVVVQLLGSIAFALSWCAIFERIGDIPPTFVRTTMTVLSGMLYVSGGSLIANIVGGKAYDSYEGRKLFFMEGFVCLVWIVIVIIYLLKKLILCFGWSTVESYAMTHRSNDDYRTHLVIDKSEYESIL